MIDPETILHVARFRAEEMQREAARFRLASTCAVPRWRRVAGRVLVRAGFRMLGARPVPALTSLQVAEAGDC